MTEADLEKILDACTPVPMIMLQCGSGRSPQERANDAWAELGSRMGFDAMTFEPAEGGNRFFTAVPSEPESQRLERETAERKAERLAKIELLKAEIAELEKEI